MQVSLGKRKVLVNGPGFDPITKKNPDFPKQVCIERKKKKNS